MILAVSTARASVVTPEPVYVRVIISLVPAARCVNEPWTHKCYALQRKQARTTVLLYSIQKVEVGRTYCASAIVLTSSVRIGRSNAMGMAQRALAAASAPTATTASTAKCVSLVHLPHLFQSITLRHRENPWSGELASHLFVSRF